MSYEHLYLTSVITLLLSFGIILFVPMPSKTALRAVYGLALSLLTFCMSWPAIFGIHTLLKIFSHLELMLVTTLLTLLTTLVIIKKEGKSRYPLNWIPLVLVLCFVFFLITLLLTFF